MKLQYLEDMRHLSNIDELVVSIDQAASKATLMMRAMGLQLNPEDTRAPMQHEVVDHLRRLVSSAYEALLEAMRTAPANAVDLQCDGYDSDEFLFDVTVTTVVDKVTTLTLDISMRLN